MLALNVTVTIQYTWRS